MIEFLSVLSLHILGACVMGVVALTILSSGWKGAAAFVEKQTRLLGYILGFELMSGSLLVFLSPTPVSFAHFCQNIIAYTIATFGVVFVAYIKTGKTLNRAKVFAPALPGLLLSAVTAVSLLS